jgi:hypothetical protein
MIFPIGQYLGATAGGAHEVSRGGVTERLDGVSFAAWGLAHGPIDPVLAAGTPWTRAELVRYTGLAGLPDAAERVDRLVDRGLLSEAPAAGPAAHAFARAHRAVPLAVGLGNTAGEPARFTIGFFDRVLLQVDALRYEVWCWSSVYETLWQVCEARSAEAGAELREPAQILDHFLAGVHLMASTNALYLDVAA